MGSPALIKPTDLLDTYRSVRQYTEQLAAPLTSEDQALQSMPDASPVKWHLAHTSWFFETFILEAFSSGYTPFHPAYKVLFNSYYNQVGQQYTRADRGLISRPSADEILVYRAHVDAAIAELFHAADNTLNDRVLVLIELGLHHEQQHQELILTDIKHAFSVNPLDPVYIAGDDKDHSESLETYKSSKLSWLNFSAGLYPVGYNGSGFCFDNELPRHQVAISDFSIASRPVTNKEYLEFVRAGGYQDSIHWLSEGWSWVQETHTRAPLYWRFEGDSVSASMNDWQSYTLHGLKRLIPEEPVTHISYFEADAYARWAGYRLPTEHEWEVASENEKGAANECEHPKFHPRIATHQFFGNVWNWTSSAYNAYPGYRVAEGAVGEYNGKFMCNQYVLRGGSCVTPSGHIRTSYRNFFPAHTRWQFSGLRLAKDA